MKPLDDILKLLDAMKELPFETMEVSAEGVTVKVSRGSGSPAGAAQAPARFGPRAVPQLPAQAPPDEIAVAVASPIIGVFYAAPSPDDTPYVRVGDHVKAGQTMCIVEAMKLMNEIPSPVSGTVLKVLAQDATEVEVGQTLFLVDPSEN